MLTIVSRAGAALNLEHRADPIFRQVSGMSKATKDRGSFRPPPVEPPRCKPRFDVGFEARRAYVAGDLAHDHRGLNGR